MQGSDALPQTEPEIRSVSDGLVAIENVDVVLNGSYGRSGNDLQIDGSDGSVIVPGYFQHSPLPDITTQHGHTIGGDTIELLAGPATPGQYAQIGTPASANPIGLVEKVEGLAFAQRTDGTEFELSDGMPVYQGDVVRLTAEAKLGITFSDGTSMSLESGARIVLNEMVYSPDGGNNSMLFNLVQGAASFVSGAVNKPGEMEITTPVAVMAIRGTTFAIGCKATPSACEALTTTGQVQVTFQGNEYPVTPDGFIRVFAASGGFSQTAYNGQYDSLLELLSEVIELRDNRIDGQDGFFDPPRRGKIPDDILEEFIVAFGLQANLSGELATTKILQQIADLLKAGELNLDGYDVGSLDNQFLDDTEIESITINGVTISGIQLSGLSPGAISTDGKSLNFNPGADFDALDAGDRATVSVSFTVRYVSGRSDVQVVDFNVDGVNDVPVAIADQAPTGQNQPIVIDVLVNDTDVDGDDNPSNFTLTSIDSVMISGGVSTSFTTGSVTFSGGRITIDPGSDFNALGVGDNAVILIGYTMSDDSGLTSSATVSITVVGANDAPVAVDDVVFIDQNDAISIDVLGNDTDIDRTDNSSNFVLASIDDITISGGIATSFVTGSVSIINNKIAIDPGNDFDDLNDGETATVTIAYTMSDSNGLASTASVVVTIAGSDDGVSIEGIGALDGDHIIDEDDLPLGSSPDTGALVQSGSFSVSAPDGYGSLVVGGQALVNAGVVVAILPMIVTAFGELQITGINLDTGVVSYTYALSANTLTHGPGDNGENEIFDNVPVVLSDDSGSTASSFLNIKIVDDVSTALPDADLVLSANGNVSGNVIAGISDNGTGGIDSSGADSGEIVGIVAGGFDAPSDGNVGSTIAGEYGELILGADGTYSYQLTSNSIPTGAQDVFTYTLKDGDGDISYTTLTIGVPAIEGLVVGANTADDAGNLESTVLPHFINSIEDGEVYGDILGGAGDDLLIGDAGGSEGFVQPLNVSYAIDISGSMRGDRLSIAKEAIKGMHTQIEEAVLANGTVGLVTIQLVAYTSRVRLDETFTWDADAEAFINDSGFTLLASIDSLVASGGTSFEPPLGDIEAFFREDTAGTERHEGAVNKVYFVSDGLDARGYDSAAIDFTGPGSPIDVEIDTYKIGSFDTDTDDQTAIMQLTSISSEGNDLSNLIIVEDPTDLNADVSNSTFILAQLGADVINAGEGNDLVFGDTPNTDWMIAAGLEGTQSSTDGDGFLTIIAHLTAVYGSAPSNQQIVDFINANSQTFIGNSAADTRGDSDVLLGGAGLDTLLGQGGDDLLNGGADADVLFGGAGGDTFQFTFDALGSVDEIKDYSFNDADVLDLEELLIVSDDSQDINDLIQVLGNAGNDFVQIRSDADANWQTITAIEVWEPGDGGFAAVNVIYDNNGEDATLTNVIVV